jgi:hypothetical protein
MTRITVYKTVTYKTEVLINEHDFVDADEDGRATIEYYVMEDAAIKAADFDGPNVKMAEKPKYCTNIDDVNVGED